MDPNHRYYEHCYSCTHILGIYLILSENNSLITDKNIIILILYNPNRVLIIGKCNRISELDSLLIDICSKEKKYIIATILIREEEIEKRRLR